MRDMELEIDEEEITTGRFREGRGLKRDQRRVKRGNSDSELEIEVIDEME